MIIRVKAGTRTVRGTDSIMRLVTIVVSLILVGLSLAEDDASLTAPPPPVKLDKNLRRALLKALTDLEEESAEQHELEGQDETLAREASSSIVDDDVAKKDLNKDLAVAQKAVFSFDDFPDDTPTEDKLQNTTFVESLKLVTTQSPMMTIEKATKEDARTYRVQNVVLPTKTDTVITKSQDLSETVEVSRATLSQASTEDPRPKITQSLSAGSLSTFDGVSRNALISPRPTQSSPTTVAPTVNATKEKSEEVKIFQAPLVAAFTVQQDERGVPKSVVPIFRSTGDGQALTLQEQIEFKQRLLEKQLAELQQQQIQQTRFLYRQRELYEQQLRQKQQQQQQQQQQLFLQEQARLKQFEEQSRLKRLEEQRLKQLEEQRSYRLQQQKQQHFFDQTNNVLSLQPPLESQNVHFQPSVALEVPSTATASPFQSNYQEQLRLQQYRRQQFQQQQQQQQQQQPHHIQHQPPQQLQQPQTQQQRLQQSFGSFSTEFQTPQAPASRFNRQEAFNSVGNFGFNVDNKSASTRVNQNNFGFAPRPIQQNFAFNPYNQFQQPSRPPTPAKQIQNLLYQSGVVGDFGNVQGAAGQEDLNIVSKVLALNVGALK